MASSLNGISVNGIAVNGVSLNGIVGQRRLAQRHLDQRHVAQRHVASTAPTSSAPPDGAAEQRRHARAADRRHRAAARRQHRRPRLHRVVRARRRLGAAVRPRPDGSAELALAVPGTWNLTTGAWSDDQRRSASRAATPRSRSASSLATSRGSASPITTTRACACCAPTTAATARRTRSTARRSTCTTTPSVQVDTECVAGRRRVGPRRRAVREPHPRRRAAGVLRGEVQRDVRQLRQRRAAGRRVQRQ